MDYNFVKYVDILDDYNRVECSYLSFGKYSSSLIIDLLKSRFETSNFEKDRDIIKLRPRGVTFSQISKMVSIAFKMARRFDGKYDKKLLPSLLNEFIIETDKITPSLIYNLDLDINVYESKNTGDVKMTIKEIERLTLPDRATIMSFLLSEGLSYSDKIKESAKLVKVKDTKDVICTTLNMTLEEAQEFAKVFESAIKDIHVSRELRDIRITRTLLDYFDNKRLKEEEVKDSNDEDNNIRRSAISVDDADVSEKIKDVEIDLKCLTKETETENVLNDVLKKICSQKDIDELCEQLLNHSILELLNKCNIDTAVSKHIVIDENGVKKTNLVLTFPSFKIRYRLGTDKLDFKFI